MVDINELTREDLLRVVQRDRFVKGEMASRIAALVQENLDLVAIVQELQQDLADVRQSEAMLFAANTTNGDQEEQPSLFPTGVPSD
jgi:hypothetical protein